MFKNVVKYVSEFFDAIFYQEETKMTEAQENYDRQVLQRKQRIEEITQKIQNMIERVCRVQGSLEIREFGFENVSSILYEGSWQEEVVAHFEKLGYTCIMNFGYDMGRIKTSLTIIWEK